MKNNIITHCFDKIMANYKNMMELIDEYIYENRYQKITGTVLNTVLREMVSSLGAGYQLAGILRASDNPKAADQRVAYLAVEPGTYLHVGGFEVTELSLLTYDAEWHMHPLGVPFGSKIAEDIAAAVTVEKTRAMAAEKALRDAIAAETKRATDAEGANAAAITTEADARAKADTTLQGNITAEETARKAADQALQAMINKKIEPFLITLTGDGSTENPYAIDKTFDEISAAYQAKSLILLDDGNYLYVAAPISVEAGNMYLTFAVTWTDDNALWAYYIQGDAQKIIINRFDFSYVLSGNLATINGENLENGGKDIKVGLPTIKAGTGLYSETFNDTPDAHSRAEGQCSHAEGLSTSAQGFASHSEGMFSTARGAYSHAEGQNTYARADYSHAEGRGVNVESESAHGEGQYNVSVLDAIHMVGIGESSSERKNAHTIKKNGKHYILGVGGYVGTEMSDGQFARIKDLATVISELESAGGGPFALAFTLGTGDKWSMDCAFEELAAAVDAKRGIIFTVNNGSYDGNLFTATLQMHSSAENVVVLQGYVNKAYIYVVVTNGSTGLTVDVSEVNLVDIDTTIPAVPSNANVPGTKAVKDNVDKYAPCVIGVDSIPMKQVATPYVVKSGELSPDRVIVLQFPVDGQTITLNVFGFIGTEDPTSPGYVLNTITGEMVQVVFNKHSKTLTASGDI